MKNKDRYDLTTIDYYIQAEATINIYNIGYQNPKREADRIAANVEKELSSLRTKCTEYSKSLSLLQ